MTRPGPDFRGARVALLESRLATETVAMVRRLGGVPVSAPALAEQALDSDRDVVAFIDRLAREENGLVVVLTGSAATRLFAAADRAGREADLAAGLRKAVVVARGPKPAGALARRGVAATVGVPEPHTTADVVAAVGPLVRPGRPATVIHYGERNQPLLTMLATTGAQVHELLLYRWTLPGDVAPLSRAIDELMAGEIPVLAFTTQVQVRHLLDVAGTRTPGLIEALNTRVLVGAVGPTCAEACVNAGIRSPVVPPRPKLMPLLVALAAAFTESHARAPTPH